MNAAAATIILLVISNVFMTLAWYGHLRMQQTDMAKNWPLLVVILVSWEIALFEYCFQVPANRLGFRENGGPFSLFQLKILQEVITLTVFTVMAMFMFQGGKLPWTPLAAFLCRSGAVGVTFVPTA